MERPLMSDADEDMYVHVDAIDAARPTLYRTGRQSSALRRSIYARQLASINRRAVKSRIYYLLMAGSATSPLEKASSGALIVLIFVSVLSAMIETVHFGDDALDSFKSTCVRIIEPLCTLIFTALYALRVWSCTTDLRLPKARDGSVHRLWGRLRWSLRPVSLLELASLLPWYIYVASFTTVDLYCCAPEEDGGTLSRDIPPGVSILRMLRVMRITRLYRFSPSLKLLARVIRLKKSDLRMAFILDGVIVIVMASVMYLCEHNANPEMRSMYTALYFTTITLTTVGYGDISPQTDAGQFIASICSAVGIGLFTLPTTILAQGFLDLKADNKRRKRAALLQLSERHRVQSLRATFAKWLRGAGILLDERGHIPERMLSTANLTAQREGPLNTRIVSLLNVRRSDEGRWTLLSNLIAWLAGHSRQSARLTGDQAKSLRAMLRQRHPALASVAELAEDSLLDIATHLAEVAREGRAASTLEEDEDAR